MPVSSIHSLRVRFAAGVGLLLLLVGTPFFYLFYTVHRDRSIDSLKQATTDMSRALIATIERAMFEHNPHSLTDTVTQLVNPELVKRVLIADKTGRVAVSTDPSMIGQRLSRESPTCRVCHARSPASREPATIVSDEQGTEVFRTMRPVYNRPACYGCHAPSERLNGVLMLDYSMSAMRARVRSDIWQMLGLAVLMLPLTLVAIAVLMNRLVVARVETLVSATRRVRLGDLATTAPLTGNDELTVLGESFNAMTAALCDSIREIERQGSYLEHVIDSIEEHVLVIDRSFRVVAANRSFVTSMGLWKGAIVGQPCAAVAHGGVTACPACPVGAVFATGAVQKTQFIVNDRDGQERQYEVYCSPLVDESGVVSQAIEVRRDITERAALEANLHHSERLASLGLLASGVSHEINNPLASVAACAQGLVRILEGGDCETTEGRGTMREYLDLIGRETMRAKAITERLLILARPSNGQAAVVEPNRAILETTSLLRFQAENAGVTLDTELQDGLPPIVAEEGHMRQLILNLVLNAIEAASAVPRRHGRVVVKSRSRNGLLELTVADNGRGIEAGDIQKIFEPFYSRRAGGQGTGLGLFIAQAIVRGLQGQIRVSSWPGEGSAFTVEVPFHDIQGGNSHR